MGEAYEKSLTNLIQDRKPKIVMGKKAPALAFPIAGESSWWEEVDPRKSILSDHAYLKIKRYLDVLIVVGSFPVLLPILAFCALLIKIESPGAPVFFKQPRTGRGGRRFFMYKFRTMLPEAEELKANYMHLNQLQWPDFKITDDPRITRVGRILRKTSLDELPQVFNILRGEMTLVGPRPTSFSHETYQLWQTERLDVTPGLTGLWQVIGRGSMEFEERARLDVAYIQRRCLWMDFNIITRTFIAVFEQKGAL